MGCGAAHYMTCLHKKFDNTAAINETISQSGGAFLPQEQCKKVQEQKSMIKNKNLAQAPINSALTPQAALP